MNNTREEAVNLTPNQVSYLFERHIQLLGIRFIKNERKNFDHEVQSAMNVLLHDAVMSNETSSQVLKTTRSNGAATTDTPSPAPILNLANLDLPRVKLRIPRSLQENVQLEPEQQDLVKFEHMIKSNKIYNEELFVDCNGNQQSYLTQLLSKTISISVGQLFLYRGQLNSSVERCLALTTNFTPPPQDNGESNSNTATPFHRYQQCFVLYAQSPAEVTDILDIFRKLHGMPNKSPSSSMHQKLTEYQVRINAEVEIQEEIYEGKWYSCPLEKQSFKLRTNLDKRICITLHQDTTHFNHPFIKVERCFGMLLCPGRNMVSSDMVAIGLNSMTSSAIHGHVNGLQQWHITGSWVPSELNFEYLNTETPRDTRVYFTVAVDLIIEYIDEPVRFIFEAKAKIVSPSSVAVSATEKFWQNLTSKSSKQMQEQFHLVLRQVPEMANSSLETPIKYQVVSCYSSTQLAQQTQRLTLELNRAKFAQNVESTPNSEEVKTFESADTPTDEQEEEEEDDEPLASGTGLVSKDCSQSELSHWKDVLDKWRQNLNVHPKQLSRLVRRGIPEALRPEIWQLLAGSHKDEDNLMQRYRSLVSKDSSFEAVIKRDINRTFPAHDFFRDAGSPGQESLFRICKAYSNYDQEIGYCQGLSFLVAALLLHMPEEQAFCVFVRIMYNYELRSLYKCGLAELHCKFYQLERLLDDNMPQLYSHFLDLNVETHMYASQWFLTLFTTKFPLNVVFLIIDIFLLDKMNTLLQMALALLKLSKNNLLALDFEGIMKYFRISLPKKYRTDEAAHELIRTAIKFNIKKAKKYEKEYRLWQEQNRIQLNPLEHLERENKRLMHTTSRLEQENDDLSAELLSTCKSKIKLQHELDQAEDKADTLNSLLLNTRSQLVEAEEDKLRLLEEVKNLKEMCRKEIEKSENEIRNNRKIIEEYKHICKNYQNQLEGERLKIVELMSDIVEKTRTCSNCTSIISEITNKQHLAVIDNGSPARGTDSSCKTGDTDKRTDSLLQKISDLETELIRTKVALAESEDRNGQLVGKLHSTNSELNLLRAQMEEAAHNRSNTWLTKTLSTIRDATKVKPSNSMTYGITSAATNSSEGQGQTDKANPETTSLHEVNVNDAENHSIRRFSSRDIYH